MPQTDYNHPNAIANHEYVGRSIAVNDVIVGRFTWWKEKQRPPGTVASPLDFVGTFEARAEVWSEELKAIGADIYSIMDPDKPLAAHQFRLRGVQVAEHFRLFPCYFLGITGDHYDMPDKHGIFRFTGDLVVEDVRKIS